MRGFQFQEVSQDNPCVACLPGDDLHTDPVVVILKTGDCVTPLCAYHVQELIMGLVESLVDSTYVDGQTKGR